MPERFAATFTAAEGNVSAAIEATVARPIKGTLNQKKAIKLLKENGWTQTRRKAPGQDDQERPPPDHASKGRRPFSSARVTATPLSLQSLTAAVGRPGAGAIVSFQGVTRQVSKLEYEAYAEMAEERIAAILGDCIERHGLQGAAAEHRAGEVPLGEPSVIVAVSAAHREEAFAGAREAIDRIKSEAPIWKREVQSDGEARWAAGETPPLDESRGRSG